MHPQSVVVKGRKKAVAWKNLEILRSTLLFDAILCIYSEISKLNGKKYQNRMLRNIYSEQYVVLNNMNFISV